MYDNCCKKNKKYCIILLVGLKECWQWKYVHVSIMGQSEHFNKTLNT